MSCRLFRFCEPSTETKEGRTPRFTSASPQSPALPSTSASEKAEVCSVSQSHARSSNMTAAQTACYSGTLCEFMSVLCYVMRCDSQPGTSVSLGAPLWLFLFLTHPLRASRAARRGLRSHQHWHGHCDHLSLSAGRHADRGPGKTEGPAMGETLGVSACAVLVSIPHIQFGHLTGDVGLCHDSAW